MSTGCLPSLRGKRIAAGLSQEEFALLAGVGQSLISRLERGQVTDTHLSTVRRFAAVLGCGVDALLQVPAEDKRNPGAVGACDSAASFPREGAGND